MTKQQNRGLGRGVNAIFGNDVDMTSFRRPVQYVNKSANEAAASPGEVCLINISEIVPNPFQPRITFDEQALFELATSIRTLGLIQPVTVRRIADHRYQIISGERRYRASLKAGLPTIPAYIRDTDDHGMLEMAIVENVQRADLDPIETAMSYKRLIEECQLTQEDMADRIGKSRVSVTNYLRLLKLPAKVQYDVKLGNISVGHAKVLLGLEDSALQERLSDMIISQGLSVRALEQLIKNGVPAGASQEKPEKKEKDNGEDLPDRFYDVADVLGRYFNNNVSIRRSSAGKGVISLRFDSDAQVEAFLEVLKEKGL